MITFVMIVHIFVAVLLIGLVLIQDSKGGNTGGIWGGGGSQTVFGSTGATTFLVKLTRGAAVVFAITCVTLTWMAGKGQKSVIDSYVPSSTTQSAPATTPAAPAENSATPPATQDSTPAESK